MPTEGPLSFFLYVLLATSHFVQWYSFDKAPGEEMLRIANAKQLHKWEEASLCYPVNF